MWFAFDNNDFLNQNVSEGIIFLFFILKYRNGETGKIVDIGDFC